jgi:hypothetical protein
MTDAERRERARLRSERWRRAHGIMPRGPAQKPWLAEGISRSTWYTRGYRVRDFVKRFDEVRETEVTSSRLTSLSSIGLKKSVDAFSRAEAFVAALQADLIEAARCNAIAAALIAELQDGRAP